MTVHMYRGESLDGKLFVPADGPGVAQQTLSARLSKPSERFLALACEGGTCLVARDWIVRVDLADGDDVSREEQPGMGSPHTVTCRLADGSELTGTLQFAMPPGRERLLDFVNSFEGFVPLHRGNAVTLVHSRHVVTWSGR